MGVSGGVAERGEWQVIGPSGSSGDHDAVHEQTQRILSDTLFHNSKRYSDLLKYIVERTLEGQHDCLKERIIGIEVFDRSPDYDTTVDSIVRGAAVEVRKRLARYYQEPNHRHELRIELPTRSYVAEFKQPGPVRFAALPESSLDLTSPRGSLPLEPQGSRVVQAASVYHIPGPRHLLVTMLVAIVCCGAWVAKRAFTPVPVIDRFWAPILKGQGKVAIAVGAHTNMRLPAPQTTATPDNASGMALSEFIGQQVAFPLAELRAASELSVFLSRHGKDSLIRLSESTTLSDLHGTPLVVMGSYPNQWAVRLGATLPFQFQKDQSLHWIEDTSNPTERKWMVDMHSPFDQVTSEYSLITRVYDPVTEQWRIGFGGLTALGTRAAQQMVLDPRTMEAFGANLPTGWERKNLQLVIQTAMVNGSLGASKVIAARTW